MADNDHEKVVVDKETVYVRDIRTKLLEPYIPLLKKYFGLPFYELELECEAAKMETNPDAVHEFSLVEYVSHDTIIKLLSKHFDLSEEPGSISSFLWLAANLYYCGNVTAHENFLIDSVINQFEEVLIREEIAQLYSFIQSRKALRMIGDEEIHLGGRPLIFASEDKKTMLTIHNTSCWFEALLENYLFPNCLPDVSSDEDAQKIWKKEESKKVGRKARFETNAIIHGVESFLHDMELVTSVAPTNLCNFLFDYLDAMGYLEDPTDRVYLAPNTIKVYIHNFRKTPDAPHFNNLLLEKVSLEDLSRINPEHAAYLWLFPRKHNPEQ